MWWLGKLYLLAKFVSQVIHTFRYCKELYVGGAR